MWTDVWWRNYKKICERAYKESLANKSIMQMRYNGLHNLIYRIIKIICQMNIDVTRVTGM